MTLSECSAACQWREHAGHGVESSSVVHFAHIRRSEAVCANSTRRWSKKGPIVTRTRPERLTIEVWPDVAPLAVKNFLALVTGEKGKGAAGKRLHYKVGMWAWGRH